MTWNFFGTAQLIFRFDRIWNCLRLSPLGWIFFRLKHDLKISMIEIFKMQLRFDNDLIWFIVRIISVRCHRFSTTTRFGNVSESFRWDAIGFRQGHKKISYNNFGKMQMNIGSDTIWKCLRIISMTINVFQLKYHLKMS